MDTPYQWTKQVASHWGGTRNGTIVHWPDGIKPKGEIRTQFSHVIDVAATILDAAGLPEPTFVHGVQQMPLQGRSMRPTFDDAAAPEHRETQYFEMFVNRGIFHKGWTAVTRHSTPWVMAPTPALDDDVWELLGPDDWTQAHDLAADQPDKLRELQRLFLIEATKYNVLPLDDRRVWERVRTRSIAGRPSAGSGASTELLFGGMGRLFGELGHQHQEQVSCGDRPDRGQRRHDAGRRHRRPGRCVRRLRPVCPRRGARLLLPDLFGLQRFKVHGDAPIGPGEHQVRVEFAYDGGGLAKGGDVTLFLDGTKVGEGRVDATVPMVFSADETTDVGSDSATPVSDDYGPRDSRFTGRINWVQIDLGDDAQDADHLISPEELYRVAMARQ